ncbi:amino acid/polyamine transporter I [Pisolithus orientalis]|uniref:amino acid/polyamine transporter I n=1 Tax=Pisolithus orientalis TaxID=936130 RepID=UPI0022255C7A|nr:amino acid/polyamine transporter I [Pisolithus orientalis]KAI5984921.1 amino acid/polyamine transporter I [Pisolithus orientalis]
MNRPSIGASSSKEAIAKRDEALLAQLGYKQEFKRAFKPSEVFGIAFSIIGLLPSIASVLVYALSNGGASSMVWGWVVGSLLILSVGLSMAELGSAAPTSGGLYYWAYSLSSPRWRNLLSWVVGYANTVGSIASVASIDWSCAVQVAAAASIGSGQTFVATTGQLYGIYIAILLSHAVVCCLGTVVLARLQSIYVAINILLCIAVIIVLPAATPKEYINSASYALGNFTNLNGWPNGFAFVLSLVAPLWTICSFDCAVHISEEAANAATAVPWAIVSSIIVAGILGLAINIALVFCMGTDIEYTLNSPIGQPMAQIFFNSLGTKATLAVWTFVVIAQYMMGSSMLLGASRQTFAFARDGALPLSNILYRVNSFTGTPVNTVWFVVLMAGLLGLLAFAGTGAIDAIFTMSNSSLYVAYAIPIFARFAFDNDFKPGPFNLGIFSLPIGVIAIVFMSFMIIVFSFPTTPTTNAANMNYAIVVFGGVMVLSLVWYYFPVYGGIHWFTGPVPNIDADKKDETGGMYDDYASKEKSAEGSVKVVRV